MGVPFSQINEARLYRGLDVLQAHKEQLCTHLLNRYQDWFGVEFEFLLYDVTSTFFEGAQKGNALAQRGYSRDGRPDCKQVCIGLVVTRKGLPLGYEVFAGNRHDSTTLEEIVETMEARYGKANRIWTLDRGMISEHNVEFLKQEGRRYIVGTPKGMLKRFESELLSSDWKQVHEGLEVRLCPAPDGAEATSPVPLPGLSELVAKLAPGHEMWFCDGRLRFAIDQTDGGEDDDLAEHDVTGVAVPELLARLDFLSAFPPVGAGVGEHILWHLLRLALLRTFLALIFEF